jgi:positive regulator of sigma E activity
MFKEPVKVIDVVVNKVRIKFQKRGMCSSCKSLHICNVDKEETLLIDNDTNLSLKKDDIIEVGIEEKKTLLAAVFTFLVPGILFLLALIILKNIADILSFAIAVSFVVFYYFIVKIILKKKSKYFNLKIIRKL